MQTEKSIFISYRRTSIPIAQSVRLSLVAHGYDIFFDFESINSGAFDQMILNQVASRAHFLLILTPAALERCTEPDDWVRKEIETAITHQRNIIPLMFEGFRFESVQHYLKGEQLHLLPQYNGLPVYATAYSNRGNVYLQMLDYERAIADFEAALVLEQQHEIASQLLVYARSMRDDDRLTVLFIHTTER